MKSLTVYLSLNLEVDPNHAKVARERQ